MTPSVMMASFPMSRVLPMTVAMTMQSVATMMAFATLFREGRTADQESGGRSQTNDDFPHLCLLKSARDNPQAGAWVPGSPGVNQER
jgi:hypothetical protein